MALRRRLARRRTHSRPSPRPTAKDNPAPSSAPSERIHQAEQGTEQGACGRDHEGDRHEQQRGEAQNAVTVAAKPSPVSAVLLGEPQRLRDRADLAYEVAARDQRDRDESENGQGAAQRHVDQPAPPRRRRQLLSTTRW